MNHDEHLDSLLDEALSEYRDAEPLAGMEDRVLQRLQSQPHARRLAWWKWGAVAACATLLLMSGWLRLGAHWGRTSPESQTVAQQQAQTLSPAPATVAAGPQRPPKIAPARVAEPANVPHSAHRGPTGYTVAAKAAGNKESRRPVFPSPTPLTPEEHALLALASSNPGVLLHQPENSRDLEIAPIAIKPLADGTVPAQENSNE